MGAIIYPSGELVISDHTNEGVPVDFAAQAIEKIAEMKSNWGNPIFRRDGYTLTFVSEMFEGCDPVEDYIEAPLKQAIEIAKANNAYIDGDIYIASDWNDYDNIHIEIAENEISMDNAEINTATDEELIAELEKRGYSVTDNNKEKHYMLNVKFCAGSDEPCDVDTGLYILSTSKEYSHEEMEALFATVNRLLSPYEEGSNFPLSYDDGLNLSTLIDGIQEYLGSEGKITMIQQASFQNNYCEIPVSRYYFIEQWQ